VPTIDHTLREPYEPDVEFVERKGPGHPDTICDLLAERMGIRIARHFLDRTGGFRHFNVDKALLSAGAVEVGWGGGRTIERSRLILAGKVDLRVAAPDRDLLTEAARADLEELAPGASDAFTVEVWLKPSSADLLPVLAPSSAEPLANDTSFAVVSLHPSPLERAVLAVSEAIDAAARSANLPVGRDVKVMGHRAGDRVALTVAAAMVASRIPDRDAYDAAVAAVAALAGAAASELVGREVPVAVNQGDRAGMPYLTLTGTSGEAGDDGQVGRGNRFGGLITPHRPMSLEASAGKNPWGHVGKTYHAVAWDAAGRLLDEGAGEVTLRLLSRIGNPVSVPDAVHLETTRRTDPDKSRRILAECLADWRGVADRFLEGAYPVA
jgi:S-adenosylmethionine synthetase